MIIGLSGYARSGKDTIANYLVEHYGFTKMSFAQPMREALVALNPNIFCDGGYMPLRTALRFYDWDSLKTAAPEIRGLLQRMGTEVGRDMLGQNIWVDYAFNSIPIGEHVVFSDVRFLNEAQRIEREGGMVWRVQRPGLAPVNSHSSETELDKHNFLVTVVNDTTENDLFTELDKTMNLLGVHNVN